MALVTKLYALLDPQTKELRYIGKTRKSLAVRLSNHLCDKTKNHRTNWLKSLQNKPIIELLDEVQGNGAEEEVAMIGIARSLGCRLVNGTDGGDGGVTLPPEAREKIRLARLGTKSSPETVEKIRKALKGNKNGLGYKHTPEALQKIQAASKARGVPLETSALGWAANKGKKRTPEQRARMSAAWRPPSPEQREKMLKNAALARARKKAANGT